MDKNENSVRIDDMLSLAEQGEYVAAAGIADSVDWRKVRTASVLEQVGDIYEHTGEYQKAIRILNLANDRVEGSKDILFRLCMLAVRMKDLEEAVDYYEQYVQRAPKNPNQYILKYQILRAQKAPLGEQIQALETFKKQEYTEEWAYELALRYREAGMISECTAECDELILWFSEGEYVRRALELKRQYEELTPSQQEAYASESKGKAVGTSMMFQLGQEEESEEEPAMSETSAEVEESNTDEMPEPTLEQAPTADTEAGEAATPAETAADKPPIGSIMKLDEALASLLHLDKPKEVTTEEVDAAKWAEEDLAREIQKIETLETAGVPVEQESAAEGLEVDEGSEEPAESPESSDTQEIEGQMNLLDFIAAKEAKQEKTETGVKMEESVGDGEEVKMGGEDTMSKDQNEQLASKKEGVMGENKKESILPDDIQELLRDIGMDDWIEDEGEGTDSGESAHVQTAETSAAETMEFSTPTRQAAADSVGEEAEGDTDEADDLSAYEEETYEGDELDEDDEEFAEDEAEDYEEDDLEEEGDTDEVDDLSAYEEETYEGDELDEDDEEETYESDELDEDDEELDEDEAEDYEEDLDEEGDTDEVDDLSAYEEETYESDEFEEDDREEPDDQEVDLLSATTPLSRKETAKLIATGKTSPLPMDEISNALSISDTGFLVKERYDLYDQERGTEHKTLTEEQKKIFSYFDTIRGMRGQLIEVLEQDENCTNRKGTSKTGNLLVIGSKGNGKTVLAVNAVKAIQKQRRKSGRVAIVTGEAMNRKKISDIFSKLRGGALIIEKAGKMNEKTVEKLNKAMVKDTGEMLVVLEDRRKSLDRLLTSNREFRRKFTSRLEVPPLINDELVTFGQTYAQEHGYRIDEMGILALYSRIDALQREDHHVSIAEVKTVMDEAIEHCQQTSAKKLVKRVFGKATDDADRIILSENDFNI